MDENENKSARYRVDASRSRFIVRAFSTGLFSAFAHNPTIAIRDFTGEAQLSPDAPGEAYLHIRIKAISLEDTDDISDKDRREIERQMREDVLETDRYPEIVFESTSVSADKITGGQYRARITGDLSLRGVTRTCVINAQVMAGEDILRAHGEFPLRQTEFGIKPVSAAGGTIKLKDELKFTFDIVANRERE
jgi:polyisoprenoid-binding protein YceI